MGKALYIAEKPSVAQEFATETDNKTKGRLSGIRGGYRDLVCRTSGNYELSGGI